MKVAVIFVLLFATVICRPARKTSSSDSSEEVVRRPALRKQALVASKSRVIPAQRVVAAPVDKSLETSEEEAVLPQAAVEVKAGMVDMVAPTETPTVDSDEDDDDDDETEEDETEEDEDETTDESDSESGESSTLSPVTVTPVIVTEEPIIETTVDAILPTIITDPDSGRGDNIGGYPSDYKSTVYVEEKSYHKVPSPYKSYGYVDSGKKTPYGEIHGNEVEKSPKVYKQAFQIHTDFLEEDTSTPEVETQGLDMSSSVSQDQDMSHRQTTLPEEEEAAGTSDTTASESQSSSTPQEEEEEESASSDIASASQEAEEEESESSEEATATPGAADSDSNEEDSDESDSDEKGVGPDVTTDMPLVITAK
ncbi:nucleolin 2 isoform X1 [Oryzias latipes]|uniref:Secreted phosphoprotein 1 n=1 Tax=Oryzias latipes TaxID=8090 RepID=H2N329_ORYLA|nr:nucleolin 2 isoform X1 [Oryzias latipes]